MIRAGKTFFDTDYLFRVPSGRFVRLPVPARADVVDVIDGRAIMRLNDAAGGQPAGSLVAYSLAALDRGETPRAEPVFAPLASSPGPGGGWLNRRRRCTPCWWLRCGVRSATSWCSTWPG